MLINDWERWRQIMKCCLCAPGDRVEIKRLLLENNLISRLMFSQRKFKFNLCKLKNFSPASDTHSQTSSANKMKCVFEQNCVAIGWAANTFFNKGWKSWSLKIFMFMLLFASTTTKSNSTFLRLAPRKTWQALIRCSCVKLLSKLNSNLLRHARSSKMFQH